MARTKHTGSASASVPVHALPMATTMEISIKMQETRLRRKQIYLPIHLDVTETDADYALVYHTVATKINSEGHNVPYRTWLAILAGILCLSFISGLTMEESRHSPQCCHCCRQYYPLDSW